MSLVERILDFIRQDESKTRDKAPKGICPACWGRQAYDGKIRQVFKDKQLDVNNHKAAYSLIEDFVVNKMEGIKLKKDEESNCPQCGEICNDCYNK